MNKERMIEKFREINNKPIAIWCKTKEEDYEFCKQIANEYFNAAFDLDGCINDYCYYMEDGDINYGDMLCMDSNYKLIPFSEFFADELDNKPKSLEDYTLKEIKSECVNLILNNDRFCPKDCKFNSICGKKIQGWKFKTELTNDEIEVLKAIEVLYPTIKEVKYDDDFDLYVFDEELIGTNKLPSLSKDITYNIEGLLKGE